MRRGENIWPLVAVHLDPSKPHARDIFSLKSLGGLKIKVEPKKKSKIIPQCRLCQRFAHTANYCKAPWVYAFYAQSHLTTTCPIKEKVALLPAAQNALEHIAPLTVDVQKPQNRRRLHAMFHLNPLLPLTFLNPRSFFQLLQLLLLPLAPLARP